MFLLSLFSNFSTLKNVPTYPFPIYLNKGGYNKHRELGEYHERNELLQDMFIRTRSARSVHSGKNCSSGDAT